MKFSISSLFFTSSYLDSMPQRFLYTHLNSSKEMLESKILVAKYSISPLGSSTFKTRIFTGFFSFANLCSIVLSCLDKSMFRTNSVEHRITNLCPILMMASINSAEGYPRSMTNTGCSTCLIWKDAIISSAASRSLDLQ